MNEQEEEAFWFWILITEIAFLLEYLGVFGGQEYITHIFVCAKATQSHSRWGDFITSGRTDLYTKTEIMDHVPNSFAYSRGRVML